MKMWKFTGKRTDRRRALWKVHSSFKHSELNTNERWYHFLSLKGRLLHRKLFYFSKGTCKARLRVIFSVRFLFIVLRFSSHINNYIIQSFTTSSFPFNLFISPKNEILVWYYYVFENYLFMQVFKLKFPNILCYNKLRVQLSTQCCKN